VVAKGKHPSAELDPPALLSVTFRCGFPFSSLTSLSQFHSLPFPPPFGYELIDTTVGPRLTPEDSCLPSWPSVFFHSFSHFCHSSNYSSSSRWGLPGSSHHRKESDREFFYLSLSLSLTFPSSILKSSEPARMSG